MVYWCTCGWNSNRNVSASHLNMNSTFYPIWLQTWRYGLLYLRRFRSASSAKSFSIFSGKWRLAHHTRPMNASTTNTVMSPSQNGSWSIRSDNGLYGMCIMRRSHRVPSHQAWQRHCHLPFFSKHSPRLSHGLSMQGFCFWLHVCPMYPGRHWHYKKDTV